MWSGVETGAVIDQRSWSEVADESSVALDRKALAVDVSPDRSIASIALAGQRSDGLWHVELWEQRQGVGWIVPYLTSLLENNPDIRAVVMDAASPAATLIDELRQKRVRVTAPRVRDYAAACGQFFDGVMEGWLRHTDQPQVNASLSMARKRPLGDAWAWNRKSASSDITAVVAETLALWGAQNSSVTKPMRRRGRSSGREAVVL